MRKAEGSYASFSTGAGYAHYHQLKEDGDYQYESREYSYQLPDPAWKRLWEETKRTNVRSLSRELGISTESLKAVGFAWNKEADCWSHPEYDGYEEICGIKLRNRGAKYYIKGGKAGVALAENWRDSPIVLIVEGASDVAACLDMGIKALGRPSALGGSMTLTYLLADYPGNIIVVGEHDKKNPGCTNRCGECMECWPGLYSAKMMAENLSEGLGRPVSWSLPPDEAKDIRDFLILDGSFPVGKMHLFLYTPKNKKPFNRPARPKREEIQNEIKSGKWQQSSLF